MNAVTITNLKKVYKNQVHALKGIDLEISQGDFFALLGANGAGKTTIIGILTGLINKTFGDVKVFNLDLDSQLNKVKEKIGVVPQEFNFGLFERVIDIVVNQAGFYGIDRKIALPKAHEILDKLGLGDKKFQKAMNLSGGMKRRLMIARSMIHQPQLLILDEPTAGVDVELRHGMWQYLKELNQLGTTILLTTHYLEEVEQLCRNAAIIKEGKIIRKDSVKNLTRSMEKEKYLIETQDLPATFKLENFNSKVVDPHTLEVEINKSNQNFNMLIEKLNTQKVRILGIKPKGNRLEELFLSVLNNK